MMTIRLYEQSNCVAMAELFYDTVHTVCADDYTPEQLDAWASKDMDKIVWGKSFSDRFTLVAMEGKNVVGFGGIDEHGTIERLYVHKDYRRRGIGTLICERLEERVKCDINVQVPVNARPFFQRRGYRVIMEDDMELGGVLLPSVIMRKDRI